MLAHQPKGAADNDQANAHPHDAGHGQIHTGLNDRIVDEPLHFLGHDIELVDFQLDDFAGQAVSLKRFDFLDVVHAGCEILNANDAILI